MPINKDLEIQAEAKFAVLQQELRLSLIHI